MLVFLCVHSREVIVSTSTEHSNSAWVVKQTKAFLDQTSNREFKPAILMHDRDTKFTKEFAQAAREQGVQTNPLPKASPNLNGRCEKVIGTIKRECLRRFILFGRRHIDYLIAEFVDYYNLSCTEATCREITCHQSEKNRKRSSSTAWTRSL